MIVNIKTMQVEYTDAHWRLLTKKRKMALDLLYNLKKLGLIGFVYGSVARGDVNEKSDIDIVIFEPNYILLDTLNVHHKYIIQPTPWSTPKAYLSLDEDEKVVISFPLGKLKRDEVEFYNFGGLVGIEDLENNKRVPGVNKKLYIIEPTDYGHMEISLQGNEDYASKLLKISVNTIREREALLMKRKESGHSGIYLRYDISGDDTIYDVINKLYKTNKYFRRMINV